MLCQHEGAIAFDRQAYDAPTSGTHGHAYAIVKGIEPPASYNFLGIAVGFGPGVSLGFGVWRQFHM